MATLVPCPHPHGLASGNSRAPLGPGLHRGQYLDTGDDLGPSDQQATAAAWFHPAFDDGGWAAGTAPLGYTNDNSASATPTDQSRDLRYGTVPTDDPMHPNKLNDPTAKLTTSYFRKTFSVPAGQLSEIQALFVSLQRDGTNPARLSLAENLAFQSVTLVDVPVADGIYTFASLSPEQQIHFVDGPGTLTIGAGAGNDFDGDGLPDAWEIVHFGTLAFGGSDDPDADGFTNTAEFKIGTLPASGASFYRFTGPAVVTVGGVPAIRLIFPAQPAWALQPQWSPSLNAGQWLNLGPPLTGSATHTVDDTGALTGGVPPMTAGSPRRFYRVQIFVP